MGFICLIPRYFINKVRGFKMLGIEDIKRANTERANETINRKQNENISLWGDSIGAFYY